MKLIFYSINTVNPITPLKRDRYSDKTKSPTIHYSVHDSSMKLVFIFSKIWWNDENKLILKLIYEIRNNAWIRGPQNQ